MPIKLNGATSGSVELDVPAAVGSDLQLTLPATAGEVIVKEADGSVDLGDVERLLVGTSTAASSGLIQAVSVAGAELTLARDDASAVAGNQLGRISWFGNDGGTYEECGRITCEADLDHAAGDKPGRLVFSTTADGASSPTERMRITSSGVIAVAGALSSVTPATGIANGGILIRPTTVLNNAPFLSQASSAAESVALVFANSNGVVGSIRTSGSATQYNTSSDYRLKENVVDITDGITRVKQLSPRRFNFIADDTKIVDGFIAHEAQVIVPECVTGVKDEVDDEGNPVMQGIDQSKLVPLLTAALQEAIAKIETLEQRLTDGGL